MKTTDRLSPAAGETAGNWRPQGGGVPAAPATGSRLPSAPRERKPLLAALAVMLILGGALGSLLLVLQSGKRVSVIVIKPEAQTIAAGSKIPKEAIDHVLVSRDTGLKVIEWTDADILTENYFAATDLVPGSLLVTSMISKDQPAAARGQVVVGLSLKAGQYPKGLKPGDTVSAYFVGSAGSATSAQGEPNAELVKRAVIDKFEEGESDSISSSNPTVSLRVPREDAPALAKAASAGEVSLVLVPKGSG